MSMVEYIERKTKELRVKQEAEALAELEAEWIDWSERKSAAEARGLLS